MLSFFFSVNGTLPYLKTQSTVKKQCKLFYGKNIKVSKKDAKLKNDHMKSEERASTQLWVKTFSGFF